MKVVAWVAGLVMLAAGVWELREATMSRHRPASPGSLAEVVLEVDVNRATTATREEMALALFRACQLQVDSDVTASTDLGQGRFRFLVRPALDETDERQLHGCLEDWRIDHLEADVLAIRRLEPCRASTMTRPEGVGVRGTGPGSQRGCPPEGDSWSAPGSKAVEHRRASVLRTWAATSSAPSG